ncbi:MAG: CDP-diacylglycerol--glycerol-3-phosphate 3-phosphatidyltransferase [Thermaerobacter sp.]|nr:CDP-diacylglycerol--glycerol-3-phosphate 3-phosphatidyltransferase [Thermaerobacter sp.]
MTLADFVTLLRVGLTPAVMLLWQSPNLSIRWLGVILFTVAGLTDFIDGRIARASRTATKLGAYLDPLADKILVLGAGLALVAHHLLSFWLVFVILLRELSITGLRSVLRADVHMPASPVAKWKTTAQLVSLGASAVLRGWIPAVLWTVAIVLTIWTAVEYFRSHWGVID